MNYFEQALSNEAFQLPFLFYGNEALLLEKKVLEGAEKILGSTTDLLVLRPDPKSFTFVFSTLKESLQSLSLVPHEGKYKVIVLLEIEKMLPIHISLLLKTLEEKPEYSILFLTTTSIDSVLPTILSRCVKVFVGEKATSTSFKEDLPPLLEASLSKDYAKFYSLLEKLHPKIENEEHLEEIIFLTLTFYRDLEIVRSQASSSIFFEKEEAIFRKLLSCRAPSYANLLTTVERAEKAFRTHTKTKAVLESLLLL